MNFYILYKWVLFTGYVGETETKLLTVAQNQRPLKSPSRVQTNISFVQSRMLYYVCTLLGALSGLDKTDISCPINQNPEIFLGEQHSLL